MSTSTLARAQLVVLELGHFRGVEQFSKDVTMNRLFGETVDSNQITAALRQ